jgi:SAM-dependent methyltransferase
MSFVVSANAYDRFMGRYSGPLAGVFADFAGVAAGQRVLDVGCGPGALTAELVRRTGAHAVAAVDPSASFVAAMRERYPDVDVQRASAEAIPHPAATFDASLAQLVVHFMTDPLGGLREMARVTRPGGAVAACVWDYEDGIGPLHVFWEAVRRLDPVTAGERNTVGGRKGKIASLMREAGLVDVVDGSVAVTVEHTTFDEWWEPFTLGVGPAGVYTASLSPEGREQLEETCRDLHPSAPFTVRATAWAARGRVPLAS